MSRNKKVVIFLDMVLLIMTAAWILFGLSKDMTTIELGYNYVYVFVATITALLNIKMLQK